MTTQHIKNVIGSNDWLVQPSDNEQTGLLIKPVPGQVIAEIDPIPDNEAHAYAITHAVNGTWMKNINPLLVAMAIDHFEGFVNWVSQDMNVSEENEEMTMAREILKSVKLKPAVNLIKHVEYSRPPKIEEFPNGLPSWKQTHFEIVSALVLAQQETNPFIKEAMKGVGFTVLYDLADQFTNEFENLHKGREWDGEFFEEVHQFVNSKIN